MQYVVYIIPSEFINIKLNSPYSLNLRTRLIDLAIYQNLWPVLQLDTDDYQKETKVPQSSRKLDWNLKKEICDC